MTELHRGVQRDNGATSAAPGGTTQTHANLPAGSLDVGDLQWLYRGERTTVTSRRQTHLSAIDRFRARTGGEWMAEFFGTFLLVLLGCGAVAVTVVGLSGSGRRSGSFGSADWLIINWGWGLAVAFGVYIAGGVTGAHLNPAVTLAFALRRKFPWRKVPVYWLAQLVGAFAAAALIFAVYHSAIDAFGPANGTPVHTQDTFAIFATYPAKYFHGSLVGPFVDQIVGTGVLVAVIAALIDNENQAPQANMAALLVGLTVVVIGTSLGTNDGYPINPARDFGPRAFAWFTGWGSNAFPAGGYWWIPIVGPLIGGAVGIYLYDLFVGKVLAVRPPEDEPAEPGRVPESPGSEPR
jgi:glycerol uptake facilitator protein